jgi:hypothetical protein
MAISGATQTYATELAGLWTGLSRALSDLEALAARPDQRLADSDAVETLGRLRYTLHAASELTHGIVPPDGAERAHAELAFALGAARDATAAVAELLEDGGVEAILPVVPEWRGALFAVRMARTRAAQPAVDSVERDARSSLPPARAALGAITLIVVGAAAFAGGTLLQRWPVWGLGLVLLTVGCALSAQRR